MKRKRRRRKRDYPLPSGKHLEPSGEPARPHRNTQLLIISDQVLSAPSADFVNAVSLICFLSSTLLQACCRSFGCHFHSSVDLFTRDDCFAADCASVVSLRSACLFVCLLVSVPMCASFQSNSNFPFIRFEVIFSYFFLFLFCFFHD